MPHIANRGPNAIFQFAFDQETGRLAPADPPRYDPDAYLGPRALAFHPTLDVVYFSDEQGSSVSAFTIDQAGGTLTPLQTISTLPADYDGANTCSQIRITPSGRFLFAPNRGHNSVASFQVDAATGRLTFVNRAAAEPVPRAFGLDPGERFLFSTGQQTGPADLLPHRPGDGRADSSRDLRGRQQPDVGADDDARRVGTVPHPR